MSERLVFGNDGMRGLRMNGLRTSGWRIAFQGEAGAFSEEAAVKLLGADTVTVPRATFEATFRALPEGAADALMVPVENTLAGSVVRVYDLMLAGKDLVINAEIILPIEHHLIGLAGATIDQIGSVSSHPMALAQCENLFLAHPQWKRVPAEDTAGSVREIMARGDRSCAAIAGKRAAEYYKGEILAHSVQDNAENFTRFVLLEERGRVAFKDRAPEAGQPLKMSLAIRLAHRPGALLASLEPFSANRLNLLKIESRPIHGSPWEYQFFIDVEADNAEQLDQALDALPEATSELRVLGRYRSGSKLRA